MRTTPLESFECRHCEAQTQSIDEKEIAAQLCKNCFDNRNQYRKQNPHKADEKAERNLYGDQYGKNRSGKNFICASCSKKYAVVPLDFHDPTEEDIKTAYEHFVWAAPFRERSGKQNMKFKITRFDYENAPKGWTNELLCASCFNELPALFKAEAELANKEFELEQERVVEEKKKEAQEQKEKESLSGITKENPTGAIGLVVALAASAFALFKFMSTGVSDGWNAASKESPFGKVVFYILLGIAYLAAIPWLHRKGGLARELSVIMRLIAWLVFALFVIALVPKCSSDNVELRPPDDAPYYRR